MSPLEILQRENKEEEEGGGGEEEKNEEKKRVDPFTLLLSHTQVWTFFFSLSFFPLTLHQWKRQQKQKHHYTESIVR